MAHPVRGTIAHLVGLCDITAETPFSGATTARLTENLMRSVDRQVDARTAKLTETGQQTLLYNAIGNMRYFTGNPVRSTASVDLAGCANVHVGSCRQLSSRG